MAFTRGQLAEIDAGIREPAAFKTVTFSDTDEAGKFPTKASLSTALTGNDNDIDYLADTAGSAGNDISIQYISTETQPGSSTTVTVSGSTIKVRLGTAATAEKAQGTLTSDATNPDDGGTLTVGAKTYTLESALTEAYSQGTVTSTTNANPADAGTITIGAETYTFKSTLSTGPDVPFEVKIGADGEATLNNLRAALDLSGTAGVDYGVGTTANAEATAPSAAAVDTDATLVIQATELGTGGDSVVFTESATNITIDGSGTLGTTQAGVDAIANEILIGASAAATLDNIKSAVNASAGEGTTYSTGTTANATVEATTNTNTTQLFEALVAGAAGNSIVLTESATHLVVSGSGTLEQGADAGEINTTASEVITAIEASTPAAALVDVSLKSGNDGTGLVTEMAATNLSGGSSGKIPLFTVNGNVRVTLVGYCETSLTGAGATLVHGKTGTTNDLITILTATDIDAGASIDGTTGIVTRGTAPAKVPLKTYYDGEEIFATVATASVTAGKINYLAYYVALTEGASVEAV